MFDTDVTSSLDSLIGDLTSVLESVPDDVYVPSEINDSADAQALFDALATPSSAAEGVQGDTHIIDGGDLDVLFNEVALQTDFLADISANLQSIDSTSYLFNPSSTQALYFRGVMLGHPNWDYYAIQDGSNSYSLYYAGDVAQGKKVNLIQIYRNNNNTNYQIRKEEDVTCPALSSTGLVITNLYDDCARFEGLEQTRFTSFICFGLCVALGIWAFSKLLFR